MVSGLKLLYDFDRKYNLNSSGNQLSLTLPDRVAYINEGLTIWFRNKVIEAQKDQETRNDLKIFKEDQVSLKLTPTPRGIIAEYPKDFSYRLNHLAIAIKPDTCPGISKEIIPRIINSEQLHDARKDPYARPDFYYEQLLAVESKTGLTVYTDGIMDVQEILIDYYRKPQAIHMPSSEECGPKLYYIYNGEIITKDQHFEGDEYQALDIVDIAVLCASVDTKDTQAFQTKLNLILNKKSLNKI